MSEVVPMVKKEAKLWRWQPAYTECGQWCTPLNVDSGALTISQHTTECGHWCIPLNVDSGALTISQHTTDCGQWCFNYQPAYH